MYEQELRELLIVLITYGRDIVTVIFVENTIIMTSYFNCFFLNCYNSITVLQMNQAVPYITVLQETYK